MFVCSYAQNWPTDSFPYRITGNLHNGQIAGDFPNHGKNPPANCNSNKVNIKWPISNCMPTNMIHQLVKFLANSLKYWPRIDSYQDNHKPPGPRYVGTLQQTVNLKSIPRRFARPHIGPNTRYTRIGKNHTYNTNNTTPSSHDLRALVLRHMPAPTWKPYTGLWLKHPKG